MTPRTKVESCRRNTFSKWSDKLRHDDDRFRFASVADVVVGVAVIARGAAGGGDSLARPTDDGDK